MKVIEIKVEAESVDHLHDILRELLDGCPPRANAVSAPPVPQTLPQTATAAEAVQTPHEAVLTTPALVSKSRAKKAKEEKVEEPQIRTTPEDRAPVEDTPEVEAQDAADEAAEVEAAPEKELTIDDLRAAMQKYVEAFDLGQAQSDGAAIFADALGEPPAGEAFWRMSLVAAKGQDKLKIAIDAWLNAAKAGKRYGA